MLFADTALAARVEAADVRLLSEAAEAARRRGRADGEEGDVYLREIAGGVASFIRPGAPMNKLAGLGFAPFEDDAFLADLETIERAFAERGAPLQAEVSSLADPAVARLLTRRGYVAENCENVLGCPLPSAALASASAETSGEIDIRFEEGAPSAEWLDVIVQGFAAPDTQGVVSHEEFPREILERAILDLAGVEGFRTYEARVDGELAGAGSLRLAGDLAQLTGAATLPAYRRRGVQTALLRQRLHDAADAGCALALVVTQPGSKSQQNVERFGFRLLYSRLILVREPPPAS